MKTIKDSANTSSGLLSGLTVKICALLRRLLKQRMKNGHYKTDRQVIPCCYRFSKIYRKCAAEISKNKENF